MSAAHAFGELEIAEEAPMSGTLTDPRKYYREEAENLLPEATRVAIMRYAARHPIPGTTPPQAPDLPLTQPKNGP